MAIKATGTNINVEGWALVTGTTQPSGERTLIYQGSSATLSIFLAKLKTAVAGDDGGDTNTNYYDSVSVAEDASSGVATVTVVAGASTIENKQRVPDGETKMPTVVIQGSMLSPQLHQHPHFKAGLNDGLTLEALATIEWCLRNNGQVTSQDVASEPATTQELARWKMFGIDTYLAPSYTMVITHYVDIKKEGQANNVSAYIKEAGKVWKYETAVGTLPEFLKPSAVSDVPAWLAQAPTINYTKDGITVTQSFIGANKFPSFYDVEAGADGLLYDPPLLPDGHAIYPQPTSGQE